MAAISAVLALVPASGRVVASRDVYGGTHRLMTRLLAPGGMRFAWVDATRLDAVEAALAEPADLLYLESPSNPTMAITDLAAAAALGRARGALVVVDNTFLTPYLQRPLALGADLVVHSMTKFLGGHSDAIGGAVVTSSEELGARLAFVQKTAGAILAPFEAFLILRGLKTLPVRLARQEETARLLATALAADPRVRRVLYPGLPGHPGHAVQRRQADGFGAVLSIDLGSGAAAAAFVAALELARLAESLGGVETLVGHPATMSHPSLDAAEREAAGIGDGLVRISVGLEDEGDLRADLDRGLAAAVAGDIGSP